MLSCSIGLGNVVGEVRCCVRAVVASFASAGPPGYGKPSSRATLSNASPAASSRVCPILWYVQGSCASTSSVCPPETRSARSGYCGVMISVSEMSAEMMCPSMWLTGMIGMFQRRERERTKLTPTQRAGARPGPWVTARASMVLGCVLVKCCSMAESISGSRVHIVWMVLVISAEGSVCKSDSEFNTSFVRMGSIFWCSRFASDGYTPPYALCMLDWE